MSPIVAILIVWIIGIPVAFCLLARIYPVIAARRVRSALSAIDRHPGPRLVATLPHRSSVRRFAR
jgi:hypothetical protein